MSCNFRYNNTYNTIVPCKNNKISCPKENEKESWLFSLDIAKGTWRPKSTNSIINVLQFRKNDVKLLKFTDRPLRLEKNVEDVATTLDYLFNENSVKSFSIDPPNAVLTIKTNQKAFEIKQVYVKHGVVTMFLYDIQSHHDIYFQPQKHSGPMNLFIDSAFFQITKDQVAAANEVAQAVATRIKADITTAEKDATKVGVFYTKPLLQAAVRVYCGTDGVATSKTNTGYDINDWFVGGITDMSSLFLSGTVNGQFVGVYGADVFIGDIDSWDTSGVTDMSYMFYGATYFDRDIEWNTSNVNNMTGMFQNATKFNGYIDSWDTSSVTDMSYMFKGAYAFNRDISSWVVSKVTNMEYMFALLGTDSTGYGIKKSKFDFSCIVNWNVKSLKTITGIFNGVFQTQYGDKWIPNPYQGKPGLKITGSNSVLKDFLNINCSWSKINSGLPYGCCGGPAQYVTCAIKVVVDSDSDSDYYYSDDCPSDGECPRNSYYADYPPSPSSSGAAQPAPECPAAMQVLPAAAAAAAAAI